MTTKIVPSKEQDHYCLVQYLLMHWKGHQMHTVIAEGIGCCDHPIVVCVELDVSSNPGRYSIHQAARSHSG